MFRAPYYLNPDSDLALDPDLGFHDKQWKIVLKGKKSFFISKIKKFQIDFFLGRFQTLGELLSSLQKDFQLAKTKIYLYFYIFVDNFLHPGKQIRIENRNPNSKTLHLCRLKLRQKRKKNLLSSPQCSSRRKQDTGSLKWKQQNLQRDRKLRRINCILIRWEQKVRFRNIQ